MNTNQRPLAWHGSPDLKEEVLLRMKEHRANDEIVQGIYRDTDPTAVSGYRGCFLGCTLPKDVNIDEDGSPVADFSWHHAVQQLYGIPTVVGGVIESYFESISGPGFFEKAADFAVQVIEAIPVGADLKASTAVIFSSSHSAEGVLEALAAAPVPDPQ